MKKFAILCAILTLVSPSIDEMQYPRCNVDKFLYGDSDCENLNNDYDTANQAGRQPNNDGGNDGRTLREKTRLLLELLNNRTTIAPSPSDQEIDPRLSEIQHLQWETTFTPFDPVQVETAYNLTRILLEANDFEDFVHLLWEVRKIEMNDRLFLYVIYATVPLREDCMGVILPPIQEVSPHWFLHSQTINEAIQRTIKQPDVEHVVANRKTANYTEPESKLAYFREDIFMNGQHWQWHVHNPSIWYAAQTGKIKDRKGELSYYMHQQMVARYDSERMANGMPRVNPLENYRQKLVGYFPHMTSQITGVHFGGRPEGMVIKDVDSVSVQEMETWRGRIYETIDQGTARHSNGTQIPLNNEKGIDIVAAIMDSSSDTVNREFYGMLHISGHIIIGEIHDPNQKFLEHRGVMSYIEASPRDPIFFQWHKFIENTLERHKSNLEPYTRDQLALEGIKIIDVEINAKQSNILETFMKEDLSDLSHASFLRAKQPIWAKVEHLDHTPFTYMFNIDNELSEQKAVTVRVFLGPKFDGDGKAFSVEEQRILMIELDRFQKILELGRNIFTRESSESIVTAVRPAPSYNDLLEYKVENLAYDCTCGWPAHLLIPKGTADGMDFNLFVMCTDYNEDKPDEKPRRKACRDAFTYCGAINEKYPDKKPMGFPFDRRIPNTAAFRTENMFVTDVKIKFLGKA